MSPSDIPDEIVRLADARQTARDGRDFAEADRLKAAIETGGWKVVDQRTSYRLQRAWPVDVTEPDGRIRYGWSGAVPSRAEEAAVVPASIVIVAPADADALERLLAGLAGTVPDAVQRIVVANDPAAETETLLVRLGEQWAVEAGAVGSAASASGEVVWLVGRFGLAAALNAGIRRAGGSVVVLLDAAVEVIGDLVTPLVGALDDPTVAVAGPWGLVSPDQRQFGPSSDATDGATDVAAIDLAAMAFRRADYAGRGPLDEGFVEAPLLDAWWSLVLRDPEGDEMTPRRAVLVDVPAARRTEGIVAPDDRVVRRNRYRIIGTFGARRDLAVTDSGPQRDESRVRMDGSG